MKLFLTITADQMINSPRGYLSKIMTGFYFDFAPGIMSGAAIFYDRQICAHWLGTLDQDRIEQG
ncbi:MAG: hypothetical protein AB9907_10845 [Flexilinea sp.]